MILKRGYLLLAVLLLLSHPAAAREMEERGIAVLRTIDKRAARTSTFEVPVDKTVKFGSSLFIKTRACRVSSALDKPEDAAFLQIWERKPKEEAQWVFSGWMFASSPSVSRMDHPVYDVWVIECKNAETASTPAALTSEPAPAAEGMPVVDKPEVVPATPETVAPDTAEEAAPADTEGARSAPAEPEKLSPEQLNATPSFEEADGETAISAPEETPPASPAQ